MVRERQIDSEALLPSFVMVIGSRKVERRSDSRDTVK